MNSQEIVTKEAKSKKDKLWDFFSTVEMLAVAAAAILLFFSFVARITVVDGGSMNNTLSHGDKLIVSDLFYTPKRGDIVIVQSPDVLNGQVIVKRVVAVADDTVKIVKDKGVYINGTLLEEPYDKPNYDLPETKIEDGMVFLLGDNRTNSTDSHDFGQVDERSIVGRVLFRFAPLSSLGFVS